MNFNEQQLAVINAPWGPVSVSAGAGSGKTAVSVERIVTFMMAEIDAGRDPNRVLALTFTNRAGKEMKERIEKRLRERLLAGIVDEIAKVQAESELSEKEMNELVFAKELMKNFC